VKEIIMSFVGIVVAILLVANVVMPTIMAPTTTHDVATSTGAFSANGLNITVAGYNNFTTTYLDVSQVGTLTLTYEGIAAAKVNVTTPDTGTVIGNLDGTSPDSIAVSAANMAKACSTTKCVFNYTSPAGTGMGQNVTAGTLLYHQQTASTQQGWDAGTLAMWAILGIGLVAVVLLMMLGRR
jgi:hypothetical protein